MHKGCKATIDPDAGTALPFRGTAGTLFQEDRSERQPAGSDQRPILEPVFTRKREPARARSHQLTGTGQTSTEVAERVAVAAGGGTVFDGFTSAHLPWRHPRYSRRERRSYSFNHVHPKHLMRNTLSMHRLNPTT